MKVISRAIADVLAFEPPRFGDSCGVLSEVTKRSTLRPAGIAPEFLREKPSLPRAAGVLRAMPAGGPDPSATAR